jgi:hypothetical protein
MQQNEGCLVKSSDEDDHFGCMMRPQEQFRTLQLLQTNAYLLCRSRSNSWLYCWYYYCHHVNSFEKSLDASLSPEIRDSRRKGRETVQKSDSPARTEAISKEKKDTLCMSAR